LTLPADAILWVLLAGLCHACWNAVIKIGGDRVVVLAVVNLVRPSCRCKPCSASPKHGSTHLPPLASHPMARLGYGLSWVALTHFSRCLQYSESTTSPYRLSA
jgi:hypothetical protein